MFEFSAVKTTIKPGKMVKVRVIEAVLLLIAISGCTASSLKNLETQAAAIEVTEVSTEEITEETPTDFSEPGETFDEPKSNESLRSEETPAVEIKDGSNFRLTMTVVQRWSDEFLNKDSETFNKLAKGLGGELVDLVDNSQEAKEINVTNFKLVEVRPSKDSAEKVCATFIVTSEKVLNGEDLSNEISTRITLYGFIYEQPLTLEGFKFENITEEEANEAGSGKVICDLGECRGVGRERHSNTFHYFEISFN